MWKMIPNDFDVEFVGQNGEKRLFAARRKDIWHFVRASSEENSDGFSIRTNITQVHLPRFIVAEAIQSLIQFNEICNYSGQYCGCKQNGKG